MSKPLSELPFVHFGDDIRTCAPGLYAGTPDKLYGGYTCDCNPRIMMPETGGSTFDYPEKVRVVYTCFWCQKRTQHNAPFIYIHPRDAAKADIDRTAENVLALLRMLGACE